MQIASPDLRSLLRWRRRSTDPSTDKASRRLSATPPSSLTQPPPTVAPPGAAARRPPLRQRLGRQDRPHRRARGAEARGPRPRARPRLAPAPAQATRATAPRRGRPRGGGARPAEPSASARPTSRGRALAAAVGDSAGAQPPLLQNAQMCDLRRRSPRSPRRASALLAGDGPREAPRGDQDQPGPLEAPPAELLRRRCRRGATMPRR